MAVGLLKEFKPEIPGPMDQAGSTVGTPICSPEANDVEADYYRDRAETEALWASKATHPAARNAHLELALLCLIRAVSERAAHLDSHEHDAGLLRLGRTRHTAPSA